MTSTKLAPTLAPAAHWFQPNRALFKLGSARFGSTAAATHLKPGIRQRLVVALGGNALLKKGEPLSFGAQQKAAALAAPMLVNLAMSHEVILVHGNGPQVGVLVSATPPIQPEPSQAEPTRYPTSTSPSYAATPPHPTPTPIPTPPNPAPSHPIPSHPIPSYPTPPRPFFSP